MEPHAVVKDFDPFKDGGLGFAARGEVPPVNEFAFQRAPEAFHGGVVIAVAPAAHAADHASGVEVLPVKLAGVLHAPVGVMHQACWWSLLRQRHLPRRQRQGGVQGIAHRPADTAAGAAVQNPRHIQPAFGRLDIGDVRLPHGVGAELTPPFLAQTSGAQQTPRARVAATDAALRPGLLAAARHVQSRAEFVQGIISEQGFHKLEAWSLGLAKLPNVFF